MEELPDEQLIERYRAQGGSPKGDPFLNQLFKRHHRRVAAWCFRMTGNTDAAADLAQDVFLKAFQNMPAFRGDSKFTTWLYTIARNRCLTQIGGIQEKHNLDNGVGDRLNELIDLARAGAAGQEATPQP
jgi:RNA polymerase sigma factor (sigma-70 family)